MPKGRHRWLRRLIWIGCGSAVVIGLALLALWWRLQQGPVRIDFLGPRIEQALDELVAPASVTLGSLTIQWVGGGRPVEFRATDVAVLNTTGDRLATFARIGVGLDVPALLRGELVPTTLVFQDIQAVLERGADGAFDLGLAGPVPTRTDVSTDRLREWLDHGAEPPGPDSVLRRLSTISVVDSHLMIHDRMMGVDWGADPFEVSVTRSEGRLQATTSMEVDVGGRRSPLTAKVIHVAADRRTTVTVGFEQIVPSRFAGSYPGLAPLAGLDDPQSGTVELAFAEDQPVHATLELRGRPGTLSATVSGDLDSWSWTGTLQAEGLDPGALAGLRPEMAGLSRLAFRIDGNVAFVVDERRLESVDFDLTGGPGTLSIPGLYPVPLVLRGTRVKGSLTEALARIEVESTELDLQDVRVTARASARRHGDGYHGTLHARTDMASMAEVNRYWPPDAGSGARRWVMEHIPDGRILGLEFDLAAGVALTEPIGFHLDSMATGFRFEGLRVDALTPQPPIEAVEGRATITTRQLSFEVERGRLQGLEIAPSQVTIRNLGGNGPPELYLDLAAGGPLERVATLVTDRPLELVPVDLLRGLRGRSRFNLTLSIPLARDLDRKSIKTFAHAQLQDVVWKDSPVPLGDRTIRDGVLDLTVDGSELDVRGTLTLSGIPTQVELSEKFGGGEIARRVTGRLQLDDTAFRDLGMPEQEYWSGSSGIDLTYIERRDGSSRLQVDGDLERTRLRLPELGWEKPAGVAGRARLTAAGTAGGRWNIESFDIGAGDLTASGSLQLESNPFTLRELKLDRLALDGTEVHGTLAFDEATGYRIQVAGSQLDAVPLITWAEARLASPGAPVPAAAEPGPRPRPAIDLEVQLDRMTTPSPWIHVSAAASYDEEHLQRLRLQADLEPKSVNHPGADDEARAEVQPGVNTRLELTHAPQGAGHELVLKTDNLGALVDALGLSTRLNAGNATLTARRTTPDGPWSGDAEATHFTLVHAPAVARLLQLGSIRGLAATFSEDGLWFKKVDAKFTFHHRRLVVEQAKALGKGFGITAEGFLDFEQGRSGLKGAVTPMEMLQRIIGHIPLLGRLLTGWHREGVIAFLYSVTGSLHDPEINVQKFSALTPGITRELFKLKPDSTSQGKDSGKEGKKEQEKEEKKEKKETEKDKEELPDGSMDRP